MRDERRRRRSSNRAAASSRSSLRARSCWRPVSSPASASPSQRTARRSRASTDRACSSALPSARCSRPPARCARPRGCGAPAARAGAGSPLSVGAAAGGFWLAGRWSGAPPLLAFATGAVPAALLLGRVARPARSAAACDELRRARCCSRVAILARRARGHLRARAPGRGRAGRRLAARRSHGRELRERRGPRRSRDRGRARRVRAANGALRERVEWIALGVGVGAAGPLAFVGAHGAARRARPDARRISVALGRRARPARARRRSSRSTPSRVSSSAATTSRSTCRRRCSRSRSTSAGTARGCGARRACAGLVRGARARRDRRGDARRGGVSRTCSSRWCARRPSYARRAESVGAELRDERVAQQHRARLDRARIAEHRPLRRGSRSSRRAAALASVQRRRPAARAVRAASGAIARRRDRRHDDAVAVRVERPGEAGRDLARAEAARHLGARHTRRGSPVARRSDASKSRRIGSPSSVAGVAASDLADVRARGIAHHFDVGVHVRVALEVHHEPRPFEPPHLPVGIAATRALGGDRARPSAACPRRSRDSRRSTPWSAPTPPCGSMQSSAARRCGSG